MSKLLGGNSFRHIEKVVEELGLSYNKNYDHEHAVKEALLCGIAYMQLVKM